MEHTIHLGAKAFIEAIGPKQPKKKPGKGLAADELDGEGSDEEEEEEWTIDWAAVALEEAFEGDDPVDFDAGDLVGKVLALINQVYSFVGCIALCLIFPSQVRASPQAKAYFTVVCEKEGLKPLKLIKWVRTCWGSMADLIEQALVNQLITSHFNSLIQV